MPPEGIDRLGGKVSQPHHDYPLVVKIYYRSFFVDPPTKPMSENV